MSEFTSKTDSAFPNVTVYEAGGKALKVRIVWDTNPTDPNMTFTILDQDESTRCRGDLPHHNWGNSEVSIYCITKPELTIHENSRILVYLRGSDRSFDLAHCSVYKPTVRRFTPEILTKICKAICDLNDKVEDQIEQAKENARLKAEFCREATKAAAALPAYPSNPWPHSTTPTTVWNAAEKAFNEYYEALMKANEDQTAVVLKELRRKNEELSKKLQATTESNEAMNRAYMDMVQTIKALHKKYPTPLP